MALSDTGRVLGIDFGDTRTGTALSDPGRMLASAYLCIKGGMQGVCDRVAAVCREQNVTRIVVGLPRNMDGTEGERAGRVRIFCGMVEAATGLPVDTYDERLTTVEAYRMMDMTATYGRKRKASIDNLSAQIILQDWLDRQKREEKP